MNLNLLFIGTLLTSLLVMPFTASAAINKSKGADGKIEFSDQPCLPGQSAEVVKENSNAKPGTVANKQTAATDAKANGFFNGNGMPTPECRQLQKSMLDQFPPPATGRLTEAELNKISDRFDTHCVPLIKAAQEVEWAKGKAERDRLQKQYECSEKRRVYDDTNRRLAKLSDTDRDARAQLGASIERDCR